MTGRVLTKELKARLSMLEQVKAALASGQKLVVMVMIRSDDERLSRATATVGLVAVCARKSKVYSSQFAR